MWVGLSQERHGDTVVLVTLTHICHRMGSDPCSCWLQGQRHPVCNTGAAGPQQQDGSTLCTHGGGPTHALKALGHWRLPRALMAPGAVALSSLASEQWWTSSPSRLACRRMAQVRLLFPACRWPCEGEVRTCLRSAVTGLQGRQGCGSSLTSRSSKWPV